MSLAFVETGGNLQEAEAEWRIKNYSFVTAGQEKGSYLSSGPILCLGNFKFEVRLYPAGLVAGERVFASEVGMLGVYVYRTDSDPSSVTAKYVVEAISQKGKLAYPLVNRERAVKVFGSASSVEGNWGKTNSAKASLFENEEFGYKVNDTVIIKFWMQVSSGVDTNHKHMPCLTNKLASDLQELLTSGDLSDIVVECGGQSTPCHSLILQARSPVFKRMFQADMMETKSRKVKVDDIDPRAMRELIHFLYTNEMKADTGADENALCHLLQAAHKYEVASLADHCESLVEQKLSIANVVERLSFADLYDRQDLRHSCLSFITSTPAVLQEVQGTDAFEHLSETRPKLLKDILAMSSGVLKKRKRQVQADAFEFPDGSDWAKFTLPNLKKACQERGLCDTGVKATLRARLENHTT